MKRPITLTLRTDVIDALNAAAAADLRSRSGLADLLIARGLAEISAQVRSASPDLNPQQAGTA